MMKISEKEKKLMEKIKKAKQDLAKLQQKRKIEIGALAVKYGLDELANDRLETIFKKIAEDIA